MTCCISRLNIEVEPLTRREQQLLDLITQGKTNRQIAEIFGRSSRTVEYHRNSLMGKFQAHTSADLVRRAIVGGFVCDKVVLNGIV